MNPSKKRIGVYLAVTAIAIFFITTQIMKGGKTAAVLPDNPPEKIKINPAVIKTTQKKQFRSNEEIKKEYGKLETVTLWNGKTYTGAVVNTDETYSIITIDGLINIPMKDVKVRDIIR
jgi:hypothetical protein